MPHYSKLNVIKPLHSLMSYVSDWQHINIKKPARMQMVHTWKGGAMSTFVTVTIPVTDVLWFFHFHLCSIRKAPTWTEKDQRESSLV